MVGKNIEKWLQAGDLPKSVSKYGSTVDEIFVCYEELKEKYGSRIKEIPLGAVGIYTLHAEIQDRSPAAHGRQPQLPAPVPVTRRPDGTHTGSI